MGLILDTSILIASEHERYPQGLKSLLRTKERPQISRLRCPPVEMTILFEGRFGTFQEKH